MAAHQDITTNAFTTIDLTSYGSTARGVDGPKGTTLAAVYAPASSTIYVQVGTGITDASTDISAGGVLPAGVWTAIPCSMNDAPGSGSRPTLYLQGDANPIVRFTGGGVG